MSPRPKLARRYRQARQLARVQSTFALSPSEKIKESWNCSRLQGEGTWATQRDAASGKTYYYNTITDATQAPCSQECDHVHVHVHPHPDT